MNVIVDIADMAVSTDPETTLVTYSLGSCLGVAVHDPVAGVGGMIHCMLPLSKTDKEKAKTKPCMFVDTGIMKLLKELFKCGMTRDNAVVKVAGCAKVLDRQDLFKIGERNYTVLRKVLWKNSMLIQAEDVGGSISRTIRLDIGSGQFWLKSGGTTREL